MVPERQENLQHIIKAFVRKGEEYLEPYFYACWRRKGAKWDHIGI